ncbi:MAG: NAD(P)/FAD-dependent oxidoreductase [Proteobacteria bacterium]|nr:NAD(P)/FAD-dependent oxidoreductase [Pseudomonadota bacterium]
MDERHFVVIGNGPGGSQAALTLRRESPESRITVISKERGGFYPPHRIPELISGKISEEDLFVFSPGSFKERNIKLRSGQEVVDLDLRNQQVILEHKEKIPFDGLIIAVGGKPRIPEYLAVFSDLLMTLKTLQNAKDWVAKLSSAQKVLIVGGDLTSLAFSKILLSMQKQVYFLLSEEAFWPIRCTPALFEEVSLALSRKGILVLTPSQIRSLSVLPDKSIELRTDHDTVCADIIGAFFGLVPDIRFTARSGLKIDRGILVDEYLFTGFQGVYAAGDCAQIYHPQIQDYWVSIGHDNAVALGRIAAMNLLGSRVMANVSKESIFEVQDIKVNTSWWTEF